MSKLPMGEFLSVLRKSKGYTQQEVADILGVSNKTVSSWECGGSCPDISMLPAIAELYGVTCDELLRGEHIHADEPEKISRERLEKSLALRLERCRGTANAASWICGGLAVFAIILTLVLAAVAYQSLLGFLLGTVVLIASAVCIVVVYKRLLFTVSSDEIEGDKLKDFRKYLFRTAARVLLIDAAAFGFILPNAFIPPHFGFEFPYALGFGLVGAVLFLLIGYPVCLAAAGKNKCFDASGRGYARFRAKSFTLLCGIVVLAAAVGAVVLQQMDMRREAAVVRTEIFGSEEEFVAFAEDAPLFKAYPWEIVSEEMPATEEEVGKYAVKVLFRGDVEEADLYGYSHRKTEEGIVVSLFKYRLHIDENSDRIMEFFAMAQEMQKDGFTVESMGDTVLLTLGVDNLGADDVFGWMLLAVVAVVAALAATAAAIYIKRNKKYREKHTNDLC